MGFGHTSDWEVKLEKVATATHCNLRSPAVGLVILGFNCEAHKASAYKCNNSATFAEPQCINVLNFSKMEESKAELQRFKRAHPIWPPSTILDLIRSGFWPFLVFCGSIMHQVTKLEQSPSMRNWVIDDSTTFSARFWAPSKTPSKTMAVGRTMPNLVRA